MDPGVATNGMESCGVSGEDAYASSGGASYMAGVTDTQTSGAGSLGDGLLNNGANSTVDGAGSMVYSADSMASDVRFSNRTEFTCERLEERAVGLMKLLPKGSAYSYKVESLKEMDYSEHYSFHAKFLVNIKTKEEFDAWRQTFELETGTQFTILESRVCEGRYVDFKQMLACHHNVRRGKLGVRKHTACPTKMQVTIRSIPLRIRLDRCRVDVFHPCEISLVYNHNHAIWSGDILKHRKVLTDTDEKLIALFRLGHSPASALECIQMELEDNMAEEDRAECILADRSICPDYPHCTYIFRRHARAQQSVQQGNEQLIAYATDVNSSLGEVCVVREEYESKSLVAICLPFMKRVHKYVEEASEAVWVDSTGGGDGKGNKAYLFVADSKAGALPLAVGLMPADCGPEAVTRLFQLMKGVLPDCCFYSRGRDLGPLTFLIDDSPTEQLALQHVWPLARLFLSQQHVLQAQWRWLLLSENGIAKRDRAELFDLVKKLVLAQTEMELAIQYASFSSSPLVEKYANFRSIISMLYEAKKEKWCSAYRVFFRDTHSNSYMAASMRVLKDQAGIARCSGDMRSTEFLRQRLSIAVQKGNAAAVLGTLPQEAP